MDSASVTTPVSVARLDLPQPFDVDAMLDFLGRRVVVGVESISDRSYARTLRLPGGGAALRLSFEADHVAVRLSLTDPADLEAALQRCRWLLDTEADLVTAEAHLAEDPHLRASLSANSGLRVPGHVDGFEVAVRAVVGQQISVAGARTILGRLVDRYGDSIHGPVGLSHLFPSPPALAAADPDHLPMPRSRGRALVTLARAVSDGSVVLDRSADRVAARRSLLALPGIGPWTADYVALRALGDPDVFMATDLGVKHGLTRLGLGDAGPEVFQRWSPWRSYALMHVWKSLDGETS